MSSFLRILSLFVDTTPKPEPQPAPQPATTPPRTPRARRAPKGGAS